MTHDVFISYSHNDKTIANAIVAGLENEGIRCWIAPRDVTPGETWGGAIVNAISESKIMVMILSDDSNRSRQVLREVERATASEVIIIPFRIEEIDPTGAMAYFISAEHWLDALNPPLEAHIQKLIDTVEVILGTEQRSEKPFNDRQDKSSPAQPAMRMTSSSLEDPAVEPAPPSGPAFEFVGEYRTSHVAESLFVKDHILYLANGADDLIRINISNPAHPRPRDVYSAPGALDVTVEDGIGYVINGEDAKDFTRIDFNSQTSCTYSIQDNGTPRHFSHLAVQDKLLHLTGHNFWSVIDLKDPDNPNELFVWEPSDNSGVACSVTLGGNIAYIGAGWEGLHVFDISDPTQPKAIGGYDTPNWIVGMSLSGNTLFLSLGDSGLLALDVTDPSRPIMMDRLKTPGYIMDSSVNDGFLYVIYLVRDGDDFSESGVYAVDITDPSRLAITATYDGLREASGIQAWEDVVFVTDKPWGLVVLKLTS